MSEYEVTPNVVFAQGVELSHEANPEDLAATMRKFGVSDEGIAGRTIFLDGSEWSLQYGSVYPDWLRRIISIKIPELRDVRGEVIAISTMRMGERVPETQMNRTLEHESVHAAHRDRRDSKLALGRAARWGMPSVGAALGYCVGKLTNNEKIETAAAIAGVILGRAVADLRAPDEIEARTRKGDVSTAIRRR